MDCANNPIPLMIAFTNWLAQALAALPSADPLYKERLAAFKKLSDADFIESQKENYTSIPLRETLQQCTSQGYAKVPIAHFPQPIVKTVGDGNAAQTHTLVFVNGVWSEAQSCFDPACKEIRLHRLADLPLMEQKEVLRQYMADFESSGDLFAVLNIMLSQETYLLEIAGHIPLEKIITIQHIITQSLTHVVPRLMLKIGKGSQVAIIENWYSESTKVQNFINNLTYITLAEEARLSYYTLYTECPLFYQVNTLYCNQKDHSVFTHYAFSFGSAMLRMNLTAQVNGSHATALLYGLYILSAKEKVDHHIQVIHNCPYSISKQHYKCIVGGQSTSSFSGKIYLTPEAQQTNAYQTNNAIVLSSESRHYVKPQLEIYADDVKCSHGATVGQLDKAQLFYLQTRGIAVPLAKRLLLEAFGKEIINQVSLAALPDYLWDKLIAKLIQL